MTASVALAIVQIDKLQVVYQMHIILCKMLIPCLAGASRSPRGRLFSVRRYRNWQVFTSQRFQKKLVELKPSLALKSLLRDVPRTSEIIAARLTATATRKT